ncbi:unnamed protein product, partial [Ectocarpus sp. 4 AP-2014]
WCARQRFSCAAVSGDISEAKRCHMISCVHNKRARRSCHTRGNNARLRWSRLWFLSKLSTLEQGEGTAVSSSSRSIRFSADLMLLSASQLPCKTCRVALLL